MAAFRDSPRHDRKGAPGRPAYLRVGDIMIVATTLEIPGYRAVRHLGMVRGGAGSRMRPLLQPGNSVTAVWRARPLPILINRDISAHALDERLDHPPRLLSLSRWRTRREPTNWSWRHTRVLLTAGQCVGNRPNSG